jgi:hypothetical protein
VCAISIVTVVNVPPSAAEIKKFVFTVVIIGSRAQVSFNVADAGPVR